MARPRVSVLLTTLGRPEYFRLALTSALAQTAGDLEVVVAEDGGPEYAARIASELGDDRVRCLRNPTTIGVVPNVKGALRELRGDYVAILNDDDLWEPTLLERLSAPLDADAELALAFADHTIMDDAGREDARAAAENTHRWGRDRLRPGLHRPFVDLAILQQAVPAVMACLYRRSAVDWDALPLETRGHYDLYLAYLASRTGRGAFYVPERLSRYRVHPAMETNVGQLPNSQAAAFCWRAFAADSALAAYAPQVRARLADAEATCGVQLLRADQPGRARGHLRASIRARPAPRALAALGLSLAPPPLRRLAFAVHAQRSKRS